jgi:hypothetical protein
MGSGYNPSVAATASARGKASTRTPVHFWLSVPYYQYDLGCGTKTNTHTFRSRTPLVAAEEHDDFVIVWCDRCQNYTKVEGRQPEPLTQPVSNDDRIAFEQDKGILRERIATAVQDAGFLEHDEEIMEMAILYGVPVAEIKRINAGLRAPEGLSGQVDLCKAGLHEMTPDNISITRNRRQCKMCRAIAQRNRRLITRG